MYLLCGGVNESAETAAGGTGGNMSWCDGNILGGGGTSVSGSSLCSCLGGERGLASLTAFSPPLGDLLMDKFSGVSDSPERLRGLACFLLGCGLAGLTGGDGAGGVVCTGLRAKGVGGGDLACSSLS